MPPAITRNTTKNLSNPEWEPLKCDRFLWIPPDDGTKVVARDVYSKQEGRLITYGAGADELWILPKGKGGENVRQGSNGRIEVWGGGLIGKVEQIGDESPAKLCGLRNGDEVVRIGQCHECDECDETSSRLRRGAALFLCLALWFDELRQTLIDV